ncbi:MAG: hypothetical protein LBM70_07410 [Victivallales bacterium]|nr:hypothetical protein [Victivallales bacterium]
MSKHDDIKIAYRILQCKLRIAFCASGDNKSAVCANIDYAKQHRCKILITATLSRGYGCAEIINLVKHGNDEALWITPVDPWNTITAINNNHALNELNAEHILNTLKYAINYLNPQTPVLI